MDMSFANDLSTVYKRVVRLCEIKMRPPFIRQMLRNVLSDKEIHKIYRSVNQTGSPRGMLSNSAQWYVTGTLKRLHSSMFYVIFCNLVDSGIAYEDAVIQAYSKYAEVIKITHDEARLSADRAYLLTLLMRTNNGLSTAVCGTCSTSYIRQVHFVVRDDKECPVCNFSTASKMSAMHNPRISQNHNVLALHTKNVA